MKILVTSENYPLKNAFKISRGSKTVAQTVKVQINQDGFQGIGECVPYPHYGESPESVMDQISQVQRIDSREHLQKILPAGAARNALDCAYWQWEAHKKGVALWEFFYSEKPTKKQESLTLSLDTPEKMLAQITSKGKNFKLKLEGKREDFERIQIIAQKIPGAQFWVDANESWSLEFYKSFVVFGKNHGVTLIEQPFKVQEDECLDDLERPIPLCADESCHTLKDLTRIKNRYDVVNIKLDKTGGLTEAIALKEACQREGIKMMLGCMVGPRSTFEPLYHAMGNDADYLDLDGDVFLQHKKNF